MKLTNRFNLAALTMKIEKDMMREVARELKPTWSEEQFDAHWDEFARLRVAVARGRRKQAAKRSRASSPNAFLRTLNLWKD